MWENEFHSSQAIETFTILTQHSSYHSGKTTRLNRAKLEWQPNTTGNYRVEPNLTDGRTRPSTTSHFRICTTVAGIRSNEYSFLSYWPEILIPSALFHQAKTFVSNTARFLADCPFCLWMRFVSLCRLGWILSLAWHWQLNGRRAWKMNSNDYVDYYAVQDGSIF